ncbi:ABC transporter permease subunit [Marininema halotolerans]|uniref:ABC-2 type transport system permease protein n=1 Tax=Marininema halotolerans TaxID=1155944 RepID=A0A1I6U4Y6_9BACL|nr:hypothetical protein [Marininema halotolerans]SFS96438.1 ABC-2 type transport system permease protein [Marininema halotolerans]
MSNLGVLLQHEWKLKAKRREKRGKIKMPRVWLYVYSGIVVALVVILATYLGWKGQTRFVQIWNFNWGMLFWAIGIAVQNIKREWSNETVGWWLALPYSRGNLISAKFIASLLRWAKTLALVYLGLFAFMTYVMLLEGDGAKIPDTLVTGVEWYVIVLSLSPFVISLGTVSALLRRSTLQPIFPLIWGVGNLIINAVAALFLLTPLTLGTKCIFILISWVITLGLLRLAVHLLERHVVI